MNVTAESYAAEGEIVGGKFRIGKRIAVGSMGVVVHGRHVELDEPVAIKVLHPNLANPRFTARFVREARNAARIKSEHVPRFIDVGWLHGGLPYLVMEYLEGETLARVIARGGELPVSDAVDYVLQACEAVAAAHVNGILHRDLNPSNLFLTTRLDGSPLVKVLDFGVSRAFNSSGEREDEGLTVADVTLGSHDSQGPRATRGPRCRRPLRHLGAWWHPLQPAHSVSPVFWKDGAGYHQDHSRSDAHARAGASAYDSRRARFGDSSVSSAGP